MKVYKTLLVVAVVIAFWLFDAAMIYVTSHPYSWFVGIMHLMALVITIRAAMIIIDTWYNRNNKL